MVGIVGVCFLFERYGFVCLPPVAVFYQVYQPFQYIQDKERYIQQFQLLSAMNQLMVQDIRRYPPPVPCEYQTEQRYRCNVTFRHQFSLYHLRLHSTIITNMIQNLLSICRPCKLTSEEHTIRHTPLTRKQIYSVHLHFIMTLFPYRFDDKAEFCCRGWTHILG